MNIYIFSRFCMRFSVFDRIFVVVVVVVVVFFFAVLRMIFLRFLIDPLTDSCFVN